MTEDHANLAVFKVYDRYIHTLYVEHGADLPTVCAMLKLDCDAEKYQLNVAEMLGRCVR